MQNKLFLKAADICELLEVKQTSAYEIIGNLNKELEAQGYLTLRGKVPTKYFVKRFYGVEDTQMCIRDRCYTEDLEKAGDGQREVLGSGDLYHGCLLYTSSDTNDSD